MKKSLVVPSLNTNKKAGTLVAWLKEEGDKVEAGEAIYEIETDKVVRQVESEFAGTLVGVQVEEGDEVEEGKEVAFVEIED